MSKPIELSVQDTARSVLEHLRVNRTDRELFDLGHGEIELLREVTMKIKAPPEMKEALQSMAWTLLLLRGFLLEWDCSGFPDKKIVLPQLPYDASMLKHTHPNKAMYRDEIQSCLLFLADHQTAFQEEPWLWLQSCLMKLHDRLKIVH